MLITAAREAFRVQNQTAWLQSVTTVQQKTNRSKTWAASHDRSMGSHGGSNVFLKDTVHTLKTNHSLQQQYEYTHGTAYRVADTEWLYCTVWLDSGAVFLPFKVKVDSVVFPCRVNQCKSQQHSAVHCSASMSGILLLKRIGTVIRATITNARPRYRCCSIRVVLTHAPPAFTHLSRLS